MGEAPTCPGAECFVLQLHPVFMSGGPESHSRARREEEQEPGSEPLPATACAQQAGLEDVERAPALRVCGGVLQTQTVLEGAHCHHCSQAGPLHDASPGSGPAFTPALPQKRCPWGAGLERSGPPLPRPVPLPCTSPGFSPSPLKEPHFAAAHCLQAPPPQPPAHPRARAGAQLFRLFLAEPHPPGDARHGETAPAPPGAACGKRSIKTSAAGAVCPAGAALTLPPARASHPRRPHMPLTATFCSCSPAHPLLALFCHRCPQ